MLPSWGTGERPSCAGQRGARAGGAGRERAEECCGERGAGSGSAGPAGAARVLPSGGAPPSRRSGALPAGPPIRAGPAL